MSLAATQQYYNAADCAHKLLPALCPLTLDPEESVRKEVFSLIKALLQKLERVSRGEKVCLEGGGGGCGYEELSI